jgi:hypothetical protein
MVGKCPHNPTQLGHERVSAREVEVNYWCQECGNFTVVEATGPDDMRLAE